MKKIFIVVPVCYMALVLLILLFCISGGSGNGVGIPVVATEEQAYGYQAVGAETGVPWDIALLADAFLAKQKGEAGLEGKSPLETSLEFCMVTEREMSSRMVETDRKDPETGETIYEAIWDETGVNYYTGLDEILSYTGIEKDALPGMDINEVLDVIAERGYGKSSETTSYKTSLTVVPDLAAVLLALGLTEENCSNILQLHEAQYMAQLYGYVYDFSGIELPELVMGDVSREELARMAVSLLGHPYLLGGKSPETGVPKGPLDCSGFVDWVYIQCFGVGVSGGYLPDGVPVSGTALQWYATTPVEETALVVGDLAFLYDPGTLRAGKINHVGIYIGSVEGTEYFIHCAGKSYGTTALPSGRVGISVKSRSNTLIPVTGGTFEPAMKPCGFRYYRRPNFVFRDDERKAEL